MHRAIALLCLLAALLTACAPDPLTTPIETNESADRAAAEAAPKVHSPVLGPKMFARDAEAIDRDLSELEKQGRPQGDAAALAKFEGDVRMRLRHIKATMQALDVSIKAEASEILKESYRLELIRLDKINKEIDLLWRDVVEIRKILDAKTKGTGRIPPGFTEDELKDNMGDLESQIHKLKEQQAEVVGRLEAKYQYRIKNTAPDQGVTALTQERKVFVSLRARAQKLLQKS